MRYCIMGLPPRPGEVLVEIIRLDKVRYEVFPCGEVLTFADHAAAIATWRQLHPRIRRATIPAAVVKGRLVAAPPSRMLVSADAYAQHADETWFLDHPTAASREISPSAPWCAGNALGSTS